VTDGVHLLAAIAISLAFALAGGMAAARLGLPEIVGYLIAGIAIGPFTPGFVGDTGIALELAEIGVVLMMFGVGLHFSPQRLYHARRISLPGAALQIAVATALGTLLAVAWGWSVGSGVVFGFALSVASTVVLLRNMRAVGKLDTKDGDITVGWLVVEDLATVLFLVLLPILAPWLGGSGDGEGSWVTVALAVGKITLFVVLMLVVGSRLFAWLLRQADKTESELFTLAAFTIAIGVAVAAADLFGVSYALGAFLAGLVINEADLTHRAARETQPLETIFVALFFIAIGMLFDPAVLVKEPLKVLAVLAIILLGKTVAAYAIVRVLRYSSQTARLVSAALAQIGEFSFILAALAVSLGLLSDEARSLIVAGALLSIALNPLTFYVLTRLRPGMPASPGES
jgi:CPA2 family monovalent cation:H+ antiporter-2